MNPVFVDTGYLLALEIANDQQHQDKDYSLTDRISFVVMQRLSISTAFAFDRHFVQVGFTKEP
jgi:predicted nucleic acid-binding protein